MKLSARNQFEGKVEDIEIGIITAKVKVKVEAPATVTSVITKEAVEDLKIKKGDKVKVIIKSTEVILAKE